MEVGVHAVDESAGEVGLKPDLQRANYLILTQGAIDLRRAAEPAKAAAKKYVVPRTEAGQPDLRGVWNYGSDTPFERPSQFKDREFRYTPAGVNVLMYEATITDPEVFTRPWKISMPLYRRLDRNMQLLDFKCVEFVEELLYGKYRKGV